MATETRHVLLHLELELERSQRSTYDDERRARTVAESVAAWAARSKFVRRARITRLEIEDRWRGPKDLRSAKIAGATYGQPPLEEVTADGDPTP